jgi:hypothetical protein
MSFPSRRLFFYLHLDQSGCGLARLLVLGGDKRPLPLVKTSDTSRLLFYLVLIHIRAVICHLIL